MPDTLMPAPAAGYIPADEVRRADSLARTAYTVLVAQLPPSAADAVAPFIAESARLLAGVNLLGVWAIYCTHTVDVGGANLRDDSTGMWLDLARRMAGTLVTGLDLARSVQDRSDVARAAAEAIRGQLPALERLASELAACRDNADLLALAARHYPRYGYPFPEEHFTPTVEPGFTMEEFAAAADRFVPSQAMLDEDWSAMAPKKEG